MGGGLSRLARTSAGALGVGSLLAGALSLGYPATAMSDQLIRVTIDASGQAPAALDPISGTTAEANYDVADQVTTMQPDTSSIFGSGPKSGMSMARLATLSGVPLDTTKLTGVTLTDDATQSPTVDMTGAEVVDGFSNPNPGDTTPSQALLSGGSGTSAFRFIRPMRSAGDQNLDDAFVNGLTGHGGVDVTFHVAGKLFLVDPPTATPMTIKAGQPVNFTGPVPTLDGAPVASGLTYTWDFGDKTTGSNRSTRHTYLSDGTYRVFVTVADAAGNSGSSRAPVVIQVDPSSGDGQGGGGGGDQQTGGGTADERTGLASGTQTGATRAPATLRAGRTTAKPSKDAATGNGGNGGGAGNGSGAGGGSSAGSPTPAGGGTASSGASPEHGSSTTTPARSSRRRADPSRGGLVGVLLDSDPLGGASARSKADDASAQTAASARRSRGTGTAAKWIGWLVEGALFVIVLAMGGVLELRPGALYRRILTS